MAHGHVPGMLICDELSLAIGEALGTKPIFDPMIVCFAPLFSRSFSADANLGPSATYQRSSVGSFTDHQGVVREAPANCARFEGGRFVRNLLSATVNFNDSAWVEAGTATIDANGVIAGLDATGTQHIGQVVSAGDIEGRTFVGRIDVKGVGADIGKSVRFLYSRESGGSSPAAEGSGFIDYELTADWVTICAGSMTGLASNVDARFRVYGSPSNNASGCVIRYPQLEESTGATDPTVPNDYVSVGVGAEPNFIINGTFDSDLSSWEDAQGPHWVWESGEAYHPPTTTFQQLQQSFLIATGSWILEVGATYEVVADLRVIQGTVRFQTRTQAGSPSKDIGNTTQSGTTSFSFVASSNDNYIAFARHNSGETTEFYLDNVTIRKANPGLVGADGCAFYATTNGNTVADGTSGSDLVTNGSFATDSDWTKGTGWSISNGAAHCDGSQAGTTELQQDSIFTNGEDYLVTWTMNRSAGQVRACGSGGGTVGDWHNSPGYKTQVISAVGGNFYFQADASFVGSIELVSILAYDSSANTGITTSGTGTYLEPRLLMEPSSTNVCPYSEDLVTGWFKNNAAIDSNVAVAPDGAISLDRLNVDATSNKHEAYIVVPTTTSVTCTTSAYFKDDGAGFGFVHFGGDAVDHICVVANLTTGTITDTSTGSGSGTIDASGVVDLGNGFYRVWVTGSHDRATKYIVVGACDSGTPSYDAGRPTFNASDGDDVYIGFCQVEEGQLTSYIANTSTGSTQRNADTLSYPLETPQEEGMAIVEFVYDSGYLQDPGGSKGIVSFDDALDYNVLYNHGVSGALATYDGTTAITDYINWSANDVLIAAALWSDSDLQFNANKDGSWGAWGSGAYDGAFASDDQIAIGVDMGVPIRIGGVYLYNEDKGTDWVEAYQVPTVSGAGLS